MDVVFGLVAIAVVLTLCYFALVGLVALFSGGKLSDRKQAAWRQRMDTVFDGRKQVIYDLTYDTIPDQTLLDGADERGYRVVGPGGGRGRGTMLFERVDQPSSPGADSS